LQLGQTEIEQLGPGLGQHDVAGLQIAVVGSPLSVGQRQRVGDLDAEPQRLFDRQRPPCEP
jgi:hypothetical protein